jgi:hypothetical protein
MANNDVPQDPSRHARGSRRQKPPEAEFEIVIAEGANGETLARRQAEVLWEITQWWASRQE